MTAPITLSDEAVDAIARRLAHLLREEAPAPGALVDAAALARALGVSRHTIYAHAAELGAVRVGGGKRPRLRFDVARARAAWSEREQDAPGESPKIARRRPRAASTAAPLLPIGSRREAA